MNQSTSTLLVPTGPDDHAPTSVVSGTRRTVGVLIIAAAVAVVLWGGYGEGWSWTGLTDNATLWAWMKLLALPVALATLPLWLRSHHRMTRARRAPLIAVVVGFAIFVFLGYWLHWAWTGFAGNTLWDWFEVLLLPVVIATVKFWTAERTIEPWHRWLLLVGVGAFVLFVIVAYWLPIGWSGFADNTLFDWIRLLLVPVLMPLLIVPATTRWVERGIEEDEEIEEVRPVGYQIRVSPDRTLQAWLLPTRDGEPQLVVEGALGVIRSDAAVVPAGR